MTCPLKAGMVSPEVKCVARQWLCRHVPKATNMHATMEELLKNRHSEWQPVVVIRGEMSMAIRRYETVGSR
jgi:hypothetical protein